MSYRHTLQAAVDSLNDIEALVKGFPESGHIPAVEIDLALQKLRNVYELLLLFRDIEKSAPLKHVEENTKETQQSVTVETIEQKTKITVPEQPERPLSAEKSSEKVVEQVIEKKEIQVKNTKVEKSVKTLADQFKDRATLLESLHQTYNAEPVVHGKPITDLMSAIAINDRFTFIRELFNNDKVAFENTISILNNSANFNEAYNYMIQQFDWDMDSHAVQSLLDIIRRKYIKRRDE